LVGKLGVGKTSLQPWLRPWGQKKSEDYQHIFQNDSPKIFILSSHNFLPLVTQSQRLKGQESKRLFLTKEYKPKIVSAELDCEKDLRPTAS